MLKRGIAIVIVVMVCCAFSMGAPELAFDRTEASFGAALSGTTVHHTFIAMNVGDSELRIESVKTSCGCTVAQLAKNVLTPGESVEIPVSFSLKGRHGRQHSAVTVISNDPDTPETKLVLAGDAVASVTVTPSKVFMGQILPGESASRTADIAINEEIDLRLNSAVVVSNASDAVSETETEQWKAEITEIVPARLYRVTVSFTGQLPVGERDITIRLPTDSEAVPVIEVPVSATVAGLINHTPQEIVVDGGTEGVTRYVLVTASRDLEPDAFKIKRVVAPDSEIEVQVRPVGKMGYRIQLSNLGGSLGLSGKSLVIETDVASMPSISIPFRVIGGGADSEKPAEAHEH